VLRICKRLQKTRALYPNLVLRSLPAFPLIMGIESTRTVRHSFEKFHMSGRTGVPRAAIYPTTAGWCGLFIEAVCCQPLKTASASHTGLFPFRRSQRQSQVSFTGLITVHVKRITEHDLSLKSSDISVFLTHPELVTRSHELRGLTSFEVSDHLSTNLTRHCPIIGRTHEPHVHHTVHTVIWTLWHLNSKLFFLMPTHFKMLHQFLVAKTLAGSNLS
jgi:hypothetical protein